MNEDEKNTVLARLETMPSNLKLSIGNYGTFSKEQLIENVNDETEVGEVIVEIYMDTLRSFKDNI